MQSERWVCLYCQLVSRQRTQVAARHIQTCTQNQEERKRGGFTSATAGLLALSHEGQPWKCPSQSCNLGNSLWCWTATDSRRPLQGPSSAQYIFTCSAPLKLFNTLSSIPSQTATKGKLHTIFVCSHSNKAVSLTGGHAGVLWRNSERHAT